MTPATPALEASGFDLAIEEETDLYGRTPPYAPPIAINGGGQSPRRPARDPSRSRLPGQGEPGKDCGKWAPWLICRTDRLALLDKHHCLSPECPDRWIVHPSGCCGPKELRWAAHSHFLRGCGGRCPGWGACPVGLPPHLGGRWAHELAVGASDRFEDFIEQHGLGRIPLRQVIYTVPLDRYPENDNHQAIKSKLRRDAEGRVRQFAWRDRCPTATVESCRLSPRKGEKNWTRGKVDRRIVTFHGFGVRYCPASGSAVVHLYSCPDESDPRDRHGSYTHWHPHVHLLCFGIDVRAWGRYLEDYHRARTGRSLKECLDTGPCRSHRDDPNLPRCRGTPPFLLRQVNSRTGGFASYRGFGLRRHLVYELGHAAITDADVRTGHALSWFGDLHTWGQPPPPAVERPKCPRCKVPMEPPPWQWAVVDLLDADSDTFRFAPDFGSAGTIEFTVIRDAGPPESEEERAKWDALLEHVARERARARGDEEVETRDPSPYDRRAWGDPRPPSQAARDLRDELDRLEREGE